MENLPMLLSVAGGLAQPPAGLTRQQAEAHLHSLEDQPYYFLTLVREVVDESKPAAFRQLAALTIKTSLDSTDDAIRARRADRWEKGDKEERSQVKQQLLKTLTSPEILARKGAASAIAKIARIELPTGEWNDLVPSLLSGAANPSLDAGTKYATLLTLGYVCEELEDKEFTQDQINQILACFTAGINSEDPRNTIEIQRVSAAMLVYALTFAEYNFRDDPASRDQIMTAICKATQTPDTQVQASAFDCIIQVAQYFYASLQPYMHALFKLTTSSVDKPKDVAIRALEFWNIICEVEIAIKADSFDAKMMKYVEGALPVLVPLLCKCLLRLPDEGDSDELSVSMVATTCLGLVAQVTEDSCLPLVAEFVKSSFDHADKHYRDAATAALGCIMEGPSDGAISHFVGFFFPRLLARLVGSSDASGNKTWGEPEVSVRDSTAWTIAKIFELRFSLIDKSLFEGTLSTLRAALHDEPRVAHNVVFAIGNLAEALAEADMSSTLSPSFGLLLNELLATQARPDWDENDLRDACWTSMDELLKHATDADLPIVQAFLQHLCTLLKASLSHPMATQDDKLEQHNLQASYCGAIHVIINRLAEGIKPHAAVIVPLLCQVFTIAQSNAHEEAFTALGAVCTHLEGDFAPFLEGVHPFLVGGLKLSGQPAVCIPAVDFLGDICRSIGQAVLPHLDEYMGIVRTVLRDQSSHRSIKPHLFSVMGDVAGAAGQHFNRYLVECTTLLQVAGSKQVPANDEDLVEFLTELRYAVIEAYTGILHGFGVTSPENAMLLVPVIPEIVKLAEAIANDMFNYPEEERCEGLNASVIKSMVGLLGDMVKILHVNNTYNLVNSTMKWVQALLTWCNQIEVADEVEQAEMVSVWASNLLGTPPAR